MKPFHLAVAILFATIAIAQPQSSAPKREPPKGMKNYFLAFLLKGERRDQPRTKEELEQLQRQPGEFMQRSG